LLNLLKSPQNNGQMNVPLPNANALQEIRTELKEIKQLMGSQPQNVIREKRFLFFLEQYPKEYYAVILRWILYIIIASYSYSILKHIIDLEQVKLCSSFFENNHFLA
jgi:hypothetical protein